MAIVKQATTVFACLNRYFVEKQQKKKKINLNQFKIHFWIIVLYPLFITIRIIYICLILNNNKFCLQKNKFCNRFVLETGKKKKKKEQFLQPVSKDNQKNFSPPSSLLLSPGPSSSPSSPLNPPPFRSPYLPITRHYRQFAEVNCRPSINYFCAKTIIRSFCYFLQKKRKKRNFLSC